MGLCGDGYVTHRVRRKEGTALVSDITIKPRDAFWQGRFFFRMGLKQITFCFPPCFPHWHRARKQWEEMDMQNGITSRTALQHRRTVCPMVRATEGIQ